MKNGKMLLALVCALMLLCGVALADLDLETPGTIRIHIHTASGEDVAKGHLELYRVADPAIENHNLVFHLNEQFAGCAVSLADLSNSSIALMLEAYVEEHEEILPYLTANVPDSGWGQFANVEPGLYLVRQNGFTSSKVKYNEIESFIITVPFFDHGQNSWIYEIVAEPKVNPLPTPAPTPIVTTPPDDEELPQTGLVRWPILALGLGGVVLFGIGWGLTFTGKRKNKDA